MHKVGRGSGTILIAGLGNVGKALACFAHRNYNLRLYDTDGTRTASVFRSLVDNKRYLTKHFPGFYQSEQRRPWISCQGQQELKDLRDVDAILCAVPHHSTHEFSEMAMRHNINYLDMTEDIGHTRELRDALSWSAQSRQGLSARFLPGNGIAPGFVSLLVLEAMKQLQCKLERTLGIKEEQLVWEDVTLRVGALPVSTTSNALQYSLTWSPEGCVNQYRNPCPALRSGVETLLPPLSEEARIRIEGIEYEEFTTSGGIGTLIPTLKARKVQSATYKTLRYPGHCQYMRLILRHFSENDQVVQFLRKGLPHVDQDVVVVYVTATARVQGALYQHSITKKIHPTTVGQMQFSAIEVATAASTISMLDLMMQHQVPHGENGFCAIEKVKYEDFMKMYWSRFLL
jgi:saccharopine dehydrogenase-like NADP-dependent oxidoreductase